MQPSDATESFFRGDNLCRLVDEFDAVGRSHKMYVRAQKWIMEYYWEPEYMQCQGEG